MGRNLLLYSGHSTAATFHMANCPSNCIFPPDYFVFKNKNVKVKVKYSLVCILVLQDPPFCCRIITYLKMSGMTCILPAAKNQRKIEWVIVIAL
jgi:hypothetical protein